MSAPARSTVRVLLFASARDLAGAGDIAVSLDSGATVGDLRRAVAAGWPPLAGLLARSAVAVNHEYAADDRPVSAADEVAVLPPVSGG